MRLGLHNLPPSSCSPLGLVIMELVGEDAEIKARVDKLNQVPEATAKLVSL